MTEPIKNKMDDMTPLEYCIWRLEIHKDNQKKDAWEAQNAHDQFQAMMGVVVAAVEFMRAMDNQQIQEWSLDDLKNATGAYQKTIREIFRKQG